MVAPREWSSAVFRNAYALEVCLVIARFSDGVFTQTDVARALQIDRNLVALVTTRLEKAGLIKRLPAAGRDKPFERQPSAFWEVIARVADDLGMAPP